MVRPYVAAWLGWTHNWVGQGIKETPGQGNDVSQVDGNSCGKCLHEQAGWLESSTKEQCDLTAFLSGRKLTLQPFPCSQSNQFLPVCP